MPHNVVTLKQHPGLTLASGQPKFVPDMATPVETMTNAQRLAMSSAPFGLVVIESDTINNKKAFIGTGNGTNWLGPYTAAEVGLGGGGGLATSGIVQGAGTYSATNVRGYRVLVAGSADWSLTFTGGGVTAVPAAAMIVGQVYPEELSSITVGTGGSALLYRP